MRRDVVGVSVSVSLSLLAESEQALLVHEAVQARIADALLADEARDREGVEVAVEAPVLVDLANVDVAGPVLLRGNEAVRRGALPRHVKLDNFALVVLHFVGLAQTTRTAHL